MLDFEKYPPPPPPTSAQATTKRAITISSLNISYGNGLWLFSLENLTALDAYLVVFLWRIRDVGRDELVPERLGAYLDRAMGTKEWGDLMGEGREKSGNRVSKTLDRYSIIFTLVEWLIIIPVSICFSAQATLTGFSARSHHMSNSDPIKYQHERVEGSATRTNESQYGYGTKQCCYMLPDHNTELASTKAQVRREV